MDPIEMRSKPLCRRCSSRLRVLDKAVAKTGYLVDEQFTFADINLPPILYRVRQFPEGAEALAAATHLTRFTMTSTQSDRASRLAAPPLAARREKTALA